MKVMRERPMEPCSLLSWGDLHHRQGVEDLLNSFKAELIRGDKICDDAERSERKFQLECSGPELS